MLSRGELNLCLGRNGHVSSSLRQFPPQFSSCTFYTAPPTSPLSHCQIFPREILVGSVENKTDRLILWYLPLTSWPSPGQLPHLLSFSLLGSCPEVLSCCLVLGLCPVLSALMKPVDFRGVHMASEVISLAALTLSEKCSLFWELGWIIKVMTVELSCSSSHYSSSA